MKPKQLFFPLLMTMFSLPVFAHVGPEHAGHHFLEHILIALVVALPIAYVLGKAVFGFARNRMNMGMNIYTKKSDSAAEY